MTKNDLQPEKEFLVKYYSANKVSFDHMQPLNHHKQF